MKQRSRKNRRGAGVKISLCAMSALSCSMIALGGGDPPTKEDQHDQMMQISDSIATLRPFILSDPGAAAQYELLQSQYDAMCVDLGGDDPGQAKRDIPPDGGAGGPDGAGPPTPVHCNAATTTYSNTTPLAIPSFGVVSNTIVVAGANSVIADVNLTTSITHTWCDDLDITIRSPAGTVVTLTTDNASSFDNVFNGTVWDDDANPGGALPYTSNPGLATDRAYANNVVAPTLVPEEAMGAFIGENPNGEWRLTISDDVGGDSGSCTWGLEITALETAPYTSAASASNTTAVPISSGPPSLITSTIAVSGLGSFLSDVDCTTFITHTFNADLDITLTSPAGTIVTLTTDNGGSFDNVFNGTVWNDGANTGGQVPYTSNSGLASDRVYANNVVAPALVPEEAMAAFYGEDPNGTWTLTIRDDDATDGGSLNSWSVSLTTCTCNDPPVCPTGVSVTLWPPNHNYSEIALSAVAGVTDPNGDSISYNIDSITQDEPVNAEGDGNTSCDGIGVGSDAALIRCERQGGGNGRVYAINYTADDGFGGTCTGTVKVNVPHNSNGNPAGDDGQDYDSTECFGAADINADVVVNVTDLLRVITDWGMTGPDATLNYPDADTNVDGIVNVYDLLLVLSNWGSSG